MAKNDKEIYDAVIIGAGIGGLVCGSYLAKAGMKVLIVEQHNKPGGYCTSFRRQGFTFDAAAHSFGSYRKGGIMNKVLRELGLAEKLEIKKYDPSDIIITPDYRVNFWADTERTICELQNAFPHEAEKIKNFINYITNAQPVEFVAFRKITFKELLDQYFTDKKLKTILALPILGNGALPPSLISAFTGSKIFEEFLLDGGYYPEGGMQALPDAIADKFKESGGTLILSNMVKKIKVKDNHVIGITLVKGDFVPARFVVSNCDAHQTFFKLLGKRVVDKKILDKLNIMIPSLSTFISYIGIDNQFDGLPPAGTNVWFLSHYDLEKAYRFAKQGNFEKMGGHMVHISPDRKTIFTFVIAPFKSKTYWANNKHKLLEFFIRKVEKETVPDISKHIVYKDAATPHTLYRYTLNYKGAAYGWASFPTQLFTPELRQTTAIKGLYLTGHWTTQTQGIAGAAYLGYDTAKLILKKEKIYQKMKT